MLSKTYFANPPRIRSNLSNTRLSRRERLAAGWRSELESKPVNEGLVGAAISLARRPLFGGMTLHWRAERKQLKPIFMNGVHSELAEQLLAASVAGRVVAISATNVAKVLPMLPLWKPPTAPAQLCGFVALGNAVLPVLSTRALLGLGAETNPKLYSHIIQVEQVGGHSAGLLVDRAEGFVKPPTLNQLDAAETLNGCATAAFAFGDGVAWQIDVGRLFGKAESEILASFATEAERRRAEWTSAA